MRNSAKFVLSISFLALPLGWLAERRYQQMPRLQTHRNKPEPVDIPTADLPSVSIIVPARNEAANLQRLLPSLAALEYAGKLEQIVVDDNSTDETAVIAQSNGVRVLSLDELPAGWMGKPNACHQGTAVSTGDWLLFTDADTEHAPDSLANAIQYALDNKVDVVTFHLGHLTKGWLDSSTLMAAFAGLFAGLPRDHISINGQYILMRRDVYERSGGFEAVRGESLEDLALGYHLHDFGYHIAMLQGDDVARVAMYQSNGQMWQGMSRIGSGSLKFSGMGSLITGLFITALMTPLLVLKLALARFISIRWFWLTWSISVLSIWPWATRFGSHKLALFAPIGALVVQLSSMWGILSRLAGRGIIWKGRSV